MDIHKSYYETLYTRPVVTLPGYSAKYQLPGTLYAYLAFGGATGSAKDALAEGMLALAVEKGLLSQGQTVVEASSGSFGVALAIACAHSHHPLVLCMPATVPVERQELLAKFGAKIVLSNYVYGR
ncbi:MAG: pyridoxal-phosphate dependent enzyme, partial [Ruthenibacterium sp.]